MVSPHKAARDTAEAGMTYLIRTLAVMMPLLALVQALANSSDYRQPAAAVAVWLAVLGAGVWLVPRLRTGGLGAGESAAAVAVAVAAVAAIGAIHRVPSDPGSVDLAILGTAWLILLVVVSYSARVWVPVALLVFVVQGVLLIMEQGLNRLSLSQLGAAGLHHHGPADRVRGPADDPGHARQHGRPPGIPGQQAGGGTRRGGRHQAGTGQQAGSA